MSKNKKYKTEKNFEKEKHKNQCTCGCEEAECLCDDTCTCKQEDVDDCACGEHCTCEEVLHEEDCRENEFKLDLQRLQAEFDNYRKRNEHISEKSKEDGVIYAVNKILPVLDSFKSAKMQVQDEKFLESLNLIEKQFLHCLSDLKVEKIDAEGQQFDPKFHNAVLSGKDETKADNEILEVYQDGFKLNDRIIRHSVVRINKLD